MPDLKPLHKDSLAAALDKAKHYRLLNQPADAESICLDILEIEPNNQQAVVTLILALTDQFPGGLRRGVRRARDLLTQLTSEYEQAYYAGLICERQAKAKLTQGFPGAGFAAYEWFHDALEWFEKAEKLSPAGNDDAILRWNTCLRILDSDRTIRPAPESDSHGFLE